MKYLHRFSLSVGILLRITKMLLEIVRLPSLEIKRLGFMLASGFMITGRFITQFRVTKLCLLHMYEIFY